MAQIGPRRAADGLRRARRSGEEREGEVAACEWVRAVVAVMCHPGIGPGDMAEGGGHVRRGADASGRAEEEEVRVHPRKFGGDHIYIGRGS